MQITLDQAKALTAIAQFGTIQKAAAQLHKGHSAVLYLIRSLEEQTGLQLFDRSQYRNQLNKQGKVVLQYCQKLLATHNELTIACTKLKSGWEPELQLIYDGVVDFNLIADAMNFLNRHEVLSEVKILAAYLNEVERDFVQKKADFMVTILPIERPDIESLPLAPIDMHLVAHRSHPLHLLKQISAKQLSAHSHIIVRDSYRQLGLSTEVLNFSSTISVNDFPTKREAILRGLGFGWLPDYIMQKHLKKGELKVLKTEIKNHHRIHPRLYHHKRELRGRGAELIIKGFQS